MYKTKFVMCTLALNHLSFPGLQLCYFVRYLYPHANAIVNITVRHIYPHALGFNVSICHKITLVDLGSHPFH